MFKINIQQIDKDVDEEIIIKCHEINEEVLSLMKLFKEEQKAKAIIGMHGEKLYSLKHDEILYIEATENKTFIYCENDFFESKLKLYELEAIVPKNNFFRCSKSIILNCSKINCVTPAFNGRFEARLINGERVIISRQYVPDLKKILGL